MNAKFALTFAVVCLALALTVEAAPSSHKKGRVLPGALAVKKLVLLKFKKIIPVSLILLKSGNDGEDAELVPVYPSNEIPANVEFIPTPNGISGDKEVQAIAIPTELHEQLSAHGMADLDHLQAMLSQAEEEKEDKPANSAVVAASDELLNIKEDDESQLLSGEIMTAKKPVATAVRRLAADDVKPSVRTAVEDLPLFLYSVKDDQVQQRQVRRKFSGRRHHA